MDLKHLSKGICFTHLSLAGSLICVEILKVVKLIIRTSSCPTLISQMRNFPISIE